MWMIPTRNRPEAMRGLIKAMRDTGAVPTCAVMVDGEPYRDVEWPVHWKIHQSNEHLEMQLALNALFALYPNEHCYGVLTDHSRPETPWWETWMEKTASDNRIAMSNSTKERFNPRTGQRRITAYCIGGELARALGWIWPSFCVHLYGDDALEDIGYELNVMRYLPDVVIRALQQRDGEVEFDENHKRRWNGKPYLQRDKEAYEAWKKHEFDDLINRLSKFRCSLSAAS